MTIATGLGEPLGAISQETFPLQTLHGRLRDISREIHSGHGFTVVRGVPVDKYTREENVIIYAGISSHVATIRGRQDNSWFGKPADVVLAHVKDLSGNENDSKLIGSPAYTTEKQVFHTDAGDVIALFALGEAEEGGESYLASSWTVYNELAKTRPDLIHTLSEPWANDEYDLLALKMPSFSIANMTCCRFGKTGPPGYTARPLLYHQPPTSSTPERVIIQYARRTFVGYWSLPRTPTIPAITEAQAEALDALHYTAEKHALALQFKAGDIQFVNNLSVFHARLGFRDSATKKRHLVRLWLRDEENAWDTPEELKTRWARVYDGVQEEKQVFPLEATVRSASKATIKPEAITPDVKHIAVGA